jgi:hypothetical protein
MMEWLIRNLFCNKNFNKKDLVLIIREARASARASYFKWASRSIVLTFLESYFSSTNFTFLKIFIKFAL